MYQQNVKSEKRQKQNVGTKKLTIMLINVLF